MKHSALALTFILIFAQFVQGQMKQPFAPIAPIPETFKALPLAQIRPEGWLLLQIRQNLDGFTGHLDSLTPDLIVQDDIYGKNRLGKHSKNKDLGAVTDDGEWTSQFQWWNSETQSNWWDGYLCSAALTGSETHLKRIEKYVKAKLKTQDDDGYIGIYEPDLRYNFDDENGELWSKTTLYRVLLNWYEYKGQKKVLEAVERAVADVMAHYPAGASYPFKTKTPDSYGLSHGLAFVDVLETLYRITGNAVYRDYSLFLYQDFSSQRLNDDAQYDKIADSTYALQGHGVHTYEHLRATAAAWYASGNPALQNALKRFEDKIKRCTTASGGPAGDEFIGGRKADATSTGYEYCSIHELMHAYADLLLKSGRADYGDKAEYLFFNAAQGARHPEKSSIAYLKTDNSFAMTGSKNGADEPRQTRYQYSPTHREAAVCCVPNAGRIAPYYVRNMWMKEGNALIATLLGPCSVTTEVAGQEVTIREITEYPYQQQFTFEISQKKSAAFQIRVRKPQWATGIETKEPYRIEREYLVFDRVWGKKDVIKLSFTTTVMVGKDPSNERYFSYGPLLYVHKIPVAETVTKQYPVPGFQDLQYRPAGELRLYDYVGFHEAKYDNGAIFVRLRNRQTGTLDMLNLIPLAKTILRQATF